MAVKIIVIAAIAAWALVNIITAKKMNAYKMKEEFIEGQCLVGCLFANFFYFPAWILKGIKVLVGVMIA